MSGPDFHSFCRGVSYYEMYVWLITQINNQNSKDSNFNINFDDLNKIIFFIYFYSIVEESNNRVEFTLENLVPGEPK